MLCRITTTTDDMCERFTYFLFCFVCAIILYFELSSQFFVYLYIVRLIKKTWNFIFEKYEKKTNFYEKKICQLFLWGLLWNWIGWIFHYFFYKKFSVVFKKSYKIDKLIYSDRNKLTEYNNKRKNLITRQVMFA